MLRLKRSILFGLVLLVAVVAFVYQRGNRDDPSPANLSKDGSATTPAEVGRNAGTPVVAAAPGDASSVQDPDAWFLRQSDEVKASVLMGLGPDYGGKGSLTAYLADLERRIASGDTSAAMPAAELLRSCSLLVDGAAAKPDPANPTTLIVSACRSLPARERGVERRIVADAALAGERSAVLREWGFVPENIATSRDATARREWANAVAGRLERLANQGDYEAQLLLGRAYLAEDYGMLDHARAAEQYGAFLRNAPLSDPRREGIQRMLARICTAGRLRDARYCG